MLKGPISIDLERRTRKLHQRWEGIELNGKKVEPADRDSPSNRFKVALKVDENQPWISGVAIT